MFNAILLNQYGGPEELILGEVDDINPGPGEVLVRNTAINVNFHDIYVRSGLYQTLQPGGVLGLDAAAVIEAIGEGVHGFERGQRVGYVDPNYGSYAEKKLVEAAKLIPLPDELDDKSAAATLLKALTACVLLEHVKKVQAGQTVLIQAAAGGMGQLLCGWARHLGCTVIGTAGSEAKAKIARECGAHHTILYHEQDVATEVKKITSGNGVAAVYDSVGRDTFEGSFASLAFCGHLINFGQSSGPADPVPLSRLAEHSLTLSRPILFHYIRDAASLSALAETCFAALTAGAIKPIVPLELPLAKAAQAHSLLEARKSPGSIVLIP